MEDSFIIKIVNLTKYIDKKLIFKDIKLDIKKSETIVIIGESGTGKSTFLKTIIGLVSPTSGTIFIGREDITKLSGEKLNRIRKRIGYCFQEGALFDSLTVYENVAFPLKFNTKLKEDEIKERVKEKLSIMGMDGTQNLMPAQLSTGMQRRVGLARAIVNEPDIILYDEPTTGLDPVMTNVISDLILEMKTKLRATQIIVTHDIQTALKVADRIGYMHKGELLLVGTREEILSSKNEEVSKFIKGERT